MMEMPDFLFIQLGRDRGRTFIRKFDTKSPFDGATGYVNYDEYRRVYDELKQENDENCRLLGKSAEREIQLLQKVQQLENQVSCLMQNSESQTQTQIALIKKLDKAKDALNFYAYCQGVDGNIGHRARTTLEETKCLK